MDKKNKIIIAVLVIIIIALVCVIGLTFFGNMNPAKTNNTNATVYNFDSAFTMEVPKGTVFKKSWNDSGSFGVSKTYDDKGKKFSIQYMESPMVTSGFIDFIINELNSTGEIKIEHDGDLIIMHHIAKKSKNNVIEIDGKYKHIVLSHKNDEFVGIGGNNTDELVKMAKTIDYLG